MPLVFVKDMWSSFVTCALGKPETSPAMAKRRQICTGRAGALTGVQMFVMGAERSVPACL